MARTETRIITKLTDRICPDRIFIVQIGKRGFFGTKWITVKGFESYKDALEFKKNLDD